MQIRIQTVDDIVDDRCHILIVQPLTVDLCAQAAVRADRRVVGNMDESTLLRVQRSPRLLGETCLTRAEQ